MTTTHATVDFTRKSTNQRFANDGSLESVQILLHKLAIKCHGRVQALGLGMDFDDVLQEMNLNYVRAKNAWREDGGSLFSTYCRTVCLNNFNRSIEKLERQRTIGKISKDEKGISLDEKGEVKFQRPFGMVSECEYDNAEGMPTHIESMAAPEADSPTYGLDRAAAFQENVASLSLSARRLVALLLDSERRGDNGTPVKLRDIATRAGLRGPELLRVKLEIANKFGVQW